MSKQRFGLSVTLEATVDGETVQRSIDEQFFSDRGDQAKCQAEIFPAIRKLCEAYSFKLAEEALGGNQGRD